MNRCEKAASLFKEGFNCSQSVLAAFDDYLHLDGSTARSVAAGFGAGFGRTQLTCGAVSGR